MGPFTGVVTFRNVDIQRKFHNLEGEWKMSNECCEYCKKTPKPLIIKLPDDSPFKYLCIDCAKKLNARLDSAIREYPIRLREHEEQEKKRKEDLQKQEEFKRKNSRGHWY